MADTIVKFNKGDIICEEGKYELFFYEILEGSMTIYRNYGKDGQQEIGKADKGYIGEMGYINSLPRVGTVVADTDVSLAKIDETSFESYFKSHPEKIYSIMQCLSGRLNEIDANTEDAIATLKVALAAYEDKNPAPHGIKETMKKFSAIFKSRKAQ